MNGLRQLERGQNETSDFLYHRKLLSYDIKTLRYGCDRCADEVCKLKLARIGAQRVALQLFVLALEYGNICKGFENPPYSHMVKGAVLHIH